MTNSEALLKVMKAFGASSLNALVSHAAVDDVSPAICMECETITESEPDAEENYCEECGQYDVKSLLILAGVI